VREACTPGQFNVVHEALLFQPYQVVLGKFGRPDGVDEQGRWMWWAKWTTDLGRRPRGLLLTVAQGVAIRVNWMPY